VLNLNRNTLSLEPIHTAVNAAIERAAATTAEMPRPYLGVSIVGHDCARKIQYDWWCKPELVVRTREIFDRGHYFETRMRRLLVAAGFKFAPPEACGFAAVDGALRGHCDGIIHSGPNLPGAYLIYPFVWEHKATNAKNWRAIERDGLVKAFPQYAAQVALYQAYLELTNPALFTVTNADTCEWLHFFVPFDAELAQYWSDRAANIIAATRVGELLPRAYDDPEDGAAKCVVIASAAGGSHDQTRRQQAAQARRLYRQSRDRRLSRGRSVLLELRAPVQQHGGRASGSSGSFL
jgi:hypothetical protein